MEGESKLEPFSLFCACSHLSVGGERERVMKIHSSFIWKLKRQFQPLTLYFTCFLSLNLRSVWYDTHNLWHATDTLSSEMNPVITSSELSKTCEKCEKGENNDERHEMQNRRNEKGQKERAVHDLGKRMMMMAAFYWLMFKCTKYVCASLTMTLTRRVDQQTMEIPKWVSAGAKNWKCEATDTWQKWRRLSPLSPSFPFVCTQCIVLYILMCNMIHTHLEQWVLQYY